ncbi:hypothetical protein D9613_004354 [Agrocybe pediades]|uniref:C2H2-type domain-containing protein n=1 Tax=Agrocybe pediades TaxID=84607 RepID=A0A8H4QJL7_9AGAR|nr:hypothetical protein D9613_004354 [Agrocybe pediades]
MWFSATVPNHHYCQRCNILFHDATDLENHMNSRHHYCSPCNKVFVNEYGLHEHYRQSPRHFWCVPCKRLFSSASNYNSMNSATHRPKDVTCPFKCGGAFVSRSAMVLHLESGSCSSGVTRQMIDRYIRQKDTNNIITDPSRMIGGSSQQDVTYIASERSWNGHGYQCCLCQHEFRSLRALNSHLASPKHQDKVYICRGPNCNLRFSVVSALVQHIESEKCGVLRFKSVQSAMDSMLGSMARLTM